MATRQSQKVWCDENLQLTVSAKKLPPVTRVQAKTTARTRAEVRPKILEKKREKLHQGR